MFAYCFLSLRLTSGTELLTIILNPFGEASLQTLVHRLQASGNVLISELPWFRSHQLLQC